MTDTTIPAAPDVTAAPVWRRLVMDAQAFQRVYDTPAHLAELVMQVADLAYTHGLRDANLPAAERQVATTPSQVVAGVMNWAVQMAGNPSWAAVNAFAHAGQRARAGQHARTETDSTTTDGGNCGG